MARGTTDEGHYDACHVYTHLWLNLTVPSTRCDWVGGMWRPLLWKRALGRATAEAGPGQETPSGLVRGERPPTLL